MDVNMVQSIERGIEILRLLEAGPLGVTELANATALPKTTVHRLLKTFEAHHWVEFNRAKKYQLSWGVLPMAKSFLTSLDVRAIAQPYMVAIRDQLQQSVNLFLAQGDYRICIERVAADKPLRNDIKIGTVYPIFKGAAGKIFGAYMADFKDTDMSAGESAQIRHDGYVVTRGNRVPDAASMAVPIFSFGNKLEAVMTISGPIGDYTEERVKEYLSVMMALGQTISKQMGATL
ncbi:MAG: IclR family transcriptional regulator [Veillonella sp.]|nr:IclR family transcriptional regulator [Veillonella sp.]